MKDILNMIKKYIPEIVVSILIILLMIGYGIATKRLHSNSVYDGNYVGGNSTDAYVSVDVKWIPSVEEAPGVNKVEFSEDSGFKSDEQDAILEEEGWFLVDYTVQANGARGYFEDRVENVLVQDSWDGNTSDAYILIVEDGIGHISKSSDNIPDGGYSKCLLFCEMYFSNNGACFNTGYFEGGVSVYVEKNGNLTAYNLQIVQVCMIAGVVLSGLVYIIYCFFNRRIIFIVATLAILLIPFILSMSEFRGSSIGEWRGIEDEELVVIVPKYEKDNYIQLIGDVKEVGSISLYSDFDESIMSEFDTDSKEFKEEYKRYDVIPGYEIYPLVFVLDFIAGVVFSVAEWLFKGKKASNQTVKVGYMWEYPFGEYNILGVKYISEAFKGMEEYFVQNLNQDKVSFLSTYFSFDENTVEKPVYTDNYGKLALYNGANLEKFHNITISGEDMEIDYDLCFTSKGSYIRKKLGDMITIVYEIRRKEG